MTALYLPRCAGAGWLARIWVPLDNDLVERLFTWKDIKKIQKAWITVRKRTIRTISREVKMAEMHLQSKFHCMMNIIFILLRKAHLTFPILCRDYMLK